MGIALSSTEYWLTFPDSISDTTVHWASKEVIEMYEKYDGWDLEGVYGRVRL